MLSQFCRVDNQLGRADGILGYSGLLHMVSGTSALHILCSVDSLLRHYLRTSGKASFTLNECECKDDFDNEMLVLVSSNAKHHEEKFHVHVFLYSF